MLKTLLLSTLLALPSTYAWSILPAKGRKSAPSNLSEKKQAVTPVAKSSNTSPPKKIRREKANLCMPPSPEVFTMTVQPTIEPVGGLEQALLLRMAGNYAEAYRDFQCILHNQSYSKNERIAAQRHIISMYIENQVEMPLIEDTRYLIEKTIQIGISQISPEDIIPPFDAIGTKTLNLYLYAWRPELFTSELTPIEELNQRNQTLMQLKMALNTNMITPNKREILLKKLTEIEAILHSWLVDQ